MLNARQEIGDRRPGIGIASGKVMVIGEAVKPLLQLRIFFQRRIHVLVVQAVQQEHDHVLLSRHLVNAVPRKRLLLPAGLPELAGTAPGRQGHECDHLRPDQDHADQLDPPGPYSAAEIQQKKNGGKHAQPNSAV